ncbi:MAG: trypsin-like serine peptidase, partial [Chthoniobacterales bacterium]
MWLLAAVLGNAQTKPASVPSLPPLVPAGSQAQAPRGELLPSERYRLHVDLPAVTHDLGAVQVPAPSRTIPLQVGINRRVSLSPVAGGRRFRNPDGTQTTVFAIKSPGAVGVRVHFDRFKIPAGDEVYVRGLNAKRSSGGPYRENGTWNDGQFWSATVEGDTAVIEYQSRSGEGTFIVSEIAHIYRNVDAGMFTPDVLSCEVDASCSSVGPKNAVARIVFVDDGGGSYVCTGTLLNNSAGDRIPYFLTAAHCVSSQSEARSVESYWLYQTTSCNSNSLRGDGVTTSQGGDLLATSSANDSTLIRLVDSAPSGVGFAGWSSTAQAVNTSVFGLHHPGGSSPPSLQSYLRRSIGSVATTTSSCSASGLTNGYEINWSSGTTEPGSSGSGLFITSGSITYLVGALSCGSSTGACAGSYDFYGKFSSFYPQVASYLSPGPAVAPGGGYPGFNTALGDNALKVNDNTQGQFNTAIGFNALQANTTG